MGDKLFNDLSSRNFFLLRLFGRVFRRFSLFFYVIAAWWLFVFAWVVQHRSLNDAFYALYVHAVLLLLYMFGLWLCHRHRLLKHMSWLLYGLASIFIMAQMLAVGYFLLEHAPLDPFLILDAEDIALETVANTVGKESLLKGVMLCVFFSTVGCFLLQKTSFAKSAPHGLYVFPLLLGIVWFPYNQLIFTQSIFPFLSFSTRNMQMLAEAFDHGFPDDGVVGSVVREYGDFHSDDGRPVFILQLESMGALAVDGQATPGKGREDLIPVMWGARDQGVYIAHMWSPTIHTHRAQGSILCSGILDMFQGISTTTLVESQRPCLPNLLKADGYKTVFGSAFWKGEFGHTENR